MTQQAPIRLGVVGTGVMGGHHARIAATLDGSRLVGVYDADQARAMQIAAQYGVTAFAELDALCAEVDAVIIASPSSTHLDVMLSCVRAGCHVLVEKPIVASITEADLLLAQATRFDRVVMVGHVERFNPVVTALRPVMNPRDVFACEFHRISPTPGRDQSVDVILDLMIHDLDLALALLRDTPLEVAATGCGVRGGLIDHCAALVRFTRGTPATFTASAVGQERMRLARFFTRERQYTVNFATREVWAHTQGGTVTEPITVPSADPLAAEQRHFLESIRANSTPFSNIESGVQALRLACAIQEAARHAAVSTG